jgi:hypothetical protein
MFQRDMRKSNLISKSQLQLAKWTKNIYERNVKQETIYDLEMSEDAELELILKICNKDFTINGKDFL